MKQGKKSLTALFFEPQPILLISASLNVTDLFLSSNMGWMLDALKHCFSSCLSLGLSCMIFPFTRLLSVSHPCTFVLKVYDPFVGLCIAHA